MGILDRPLMINRFGTGPNLGMLGQHRMNGGAATAPAGQWRSLVSDLADVAILAHLYQVR